MKKSKVKNPITDTGIIVFNGNMDVTIEGKKYQLRVEYFGIDLRHANQEQPIIVLMRQHLPYNEADVGYLVRSKAYDDRHVFGLKVNKDDRSWGVFDYRDVIAWGYVDGGLNSDHFNSCHLRPEDYPEYAGQPDSEPEDFVDDEGELVSRRGVIFRYDKATGQMTYHAHVASGEPMPENATDLMRDAAKAFCDFRDKRPEVTEMHFYTDQLLRVVDDDDDSE